ncbi:pectinesterase [Nicotiana tomentosiformis]|uniref:pectinesterase n=1 Tax=Nicotiana tomentosiformis TaxID=4098 RepID=UPI00051B7050|nr:pectinesterase [Nicotiana tomentosiformis]
MAGNNRKRNVAIISVCSLILVAMIVAVAITMKGKDSDNNGQDATTSQKTIESICQTTRYQHTCVESLESSAEGSSDPKDLIQKSFQVAIKKIKEAIENSTMLQKLEKDPRAKLALENCQKLAWQAVNDLNRTHTKFESFEFNDLSHWIADLKIWLSGAITYQETCLDGFEKTTGETEEKMKRALNSSMELTSNALYMITEISSVFTSLNAGSSSRRRLLLLDEAPILGHGNELLPDWVDMRRRRLLAAKEIKPDIVVAKDGSSKYKTINEALKNIPNNRNQTYVLYIKQGVYNEKVEFTSSMTNLMVIGDGPTKTRITGNQNFKDGTPTYLTATAAVMGDYFVAKDIGFENSAGPEKHQAVALRVAADKSIFYNCHIDGYQDTLCVHTYRQFYRDCVIRGTIDFVFGDGAAVFQNCTLAVRKPLKEQHCIVTAQGRTDARQPTGLVFQNCSIVADSSYDEVKGEVKTYLGRPWKEYSRTIIMESSIDDLIQPEGWVEWNKTFALNTLFYTEFNNRGSGSSKTERAKWQGVKELQINRVQRFTASQFLDGDAWIPSTGIPYTPGFFLPPPQYDASVEYSPVDDEEYKDLGSVDPVAAPVSAPAAAPAESPTESSAEAPTTELVVVEAPQSESPVDSPAESPEESPAESPAADSEEYQTDTQVPSPAESPSGEVWLNTSDESEGSS